MVWSELASHFWSCPLGHRACSQGPGLTLRKIRNILGMTSHLAAFGCPVSFSGKSPQTEDQSGRRGHLCRYVCGFLAVSLPDA